MSSAPRPRVLDREAVADRLTEMIALLEALEQAEFLSDVPETQGARARHELGSALLLLLRRQLRELRRAVADPTAGWPADESPARPV
jgi:hypothetical protein